MKRKPLPSKKSPLAIVPGVKKSRDKMQNQETNLVEQKVTDQDYANGVMLANAIKNYITGYYRSNVGQKEIIEIALALNALNDELKAKYKLEIKRESIQ